MLHMHATHMPVRGSGWNVFRPDDVKSFRSQQCRWRSRLHSKRLRVVKPFLTQFSSLGSFLFLDQSPAWPFFGKPFFGTRQHCSLAPTAILQVSCGSTLNKPVMDVIRKWTKWILVNTRKKDRGRLTMHKVSDMPWNAYKESQMTSNVLPYDTVAKGNDHNSAFNLSYNTLLPTLISPLLATLHTSLHILHHTTQAFIGRHFNLILVNRWSPSGETSGHLSCSYLVLYICVCLFPFSVAVLNTKKFL